MKRYESKESVILDKIPTDKEDRLNVDLIPKEILKDCSTGSQKLIESFDFMEVFPDRIMEELAQIIASYSNFDTSIGGCIQFWEKMERQRSGKVKKTKAPKTKIRAMIIKFGYPVEARATYLRLKRISDAKSTNTAKKIIKRTGKFTKEEAVEFLVKIIRTGPELKSADLKLKLDAMDRVITMEGWSKDQVTGAAPLIMNFSWKPKDLEKKAEAIQIKAKQLEIEESIEE